MPDLHPKRTADLSLGPASVVHCRVCREPISVPSRFLLVVVHDGDVIKSARKARPGGSPARPREGAPGAHFDGGEQAS